jgi:hypothetical protein
LEGFHHDSDMPQHASSTVDLTTPSNMFNSSPRPSNLLSPCRSHSSAFGTLWRSRKNSAQFIVRLHLRLTSTIGVVVKYLCLVLMPLVTYYSLVYEVRCIFLLEETQLPPFNNPL